MKKSLLAQSTVGIVVFLIPTVCCAAGPYWFFTSPTTTQGYPHKSMLGAARVYASATTMISGNPAPAYTAALQFGHYVGTSQIMENWEPVTYTATPVPSPATGYFLTIGGYFSYVAPPVPPDCWQISPFDYWPMRKRDKYIKIDAGGTSANHYVWNKDLGF